MGTVAYLEHLGRVGGVDRVDAVGQSLQTREARVFGHQSASHRHVGRDEHEELVGQVREAAQQPTHRVVQRHLVVTAVREVEQQLVELLIDGRVHALCALLPRWGEGGGLVRDIRIVRSLFG